MISYEAIKNSAEIKAYVRKGNDNLGVLGFTDHSTAHTTLVAERAATILREFGYSERDIELAKIAGYMHDIGNAVNRKQHAEYGALLADTILRKVDMSDEERIIVMSAIAHHDESTGGATDAVSAALIIGDKTDVRRNRVREKDKTLFDIHDRVNYAVVGNHLVVDREERKITLDLSVDENICTMYEYFDIFLERMLMSRNAAGLLDAKFSLKVNGSKIL